MNLKTITVIIFVLAFFITAHYGHAAPVVVSGGPENDYESWIARLRDGRLMVIFDRNPDWASGDLYVTISTDDGNTWSAPSAIIADAGDQATLSFVPMPDDTIRLWYASNESGTYGIYAAWSLDGLNWTKTGRINLGWSASDMHYDPTVVLEPDSSLSMSYRGPGGAFIAHCPYRGQWDELKTMAAAAGNRPRIMKHSNGTYLLAYHRRSGPNTTNIDVFIRTSTDRIIWSDSVRLTTNMNSHDPFAVQGPDGAYLVYYGKYTSPAYNLKRRKSFDATSWQPEETITGDTVYNLQPHGFVENGDIYLVWAHEINYDTDNDVYFQKTPYLVAIESAFLPGPGISLRISPNPARDRIQIRWTLEEGRATNGRVQLSIYDAAGRLITDLSSRVLRPSSHVLWSGKDQAGRPVPSGVYLAVLTDGGRRIAQKFVVSR